MAQHNKVGKWGEDAAYKYLVAKGYAIIETNQRIGHKELDIIAMHRDRIVFVEVKTRTSDYVDPVDAITPKKISLLVKAADSYMRAKGYPHEVQFDVIVIIGSESDFTITHYPDAFLAPLSTR